MSYSANIEIKGFSFKFMNTGLFIDFEDSDISDAISANDASFFDALKHLFLMRHELDALCSMKENSIVINYELLDNSMLRYRSCMIKK